VPARSAAADAAYRRPWGFRASSARTQKPSETVSFHKVQRDGGEELVYDGDVPFAAASTPGTSFREGDSVQHPTYGRGKVVSLSGYGEDQRATVHFPTVGIKTLVLKYARLKKA